MTLETPLGRRQISCGPDEFTWNAVAGIVLPVICHQGRCLTGAARLLQGQADNSAAEA